MASAAHRPQRGRGLRGAHRVAEFVEHGANLGRNARRPALWAGRPQVRDNAVGSAPYALRSVTLSAPEPAKVRGEELRRCVLGVLARQGGLSPTTSLESAPVGRVAPSRPVAHALNMRVARPTCNRLQVGCKSDCARCMSRPGAVCRLQGDCGSGTAAFGQLQAGLSQVAGRYGMRCKSSCRWNGPRGPLRGPYGAGTGLVRGPFPRAARGSVRGDGSYDAGPRAVMRVATRDAAAVMCAAQGPASIPRWGTSGGSEQWQFDSVRQTDTACLRRRRLG